jgi:hypothetical protein
MPKLRVIIPMLNTVIKDGAFTAKRFQAGSFDGIAELIKRTADGEADQKLPALVANDGTCTEVGINDTKPFQVYHRIIDMQASDPDENNFGDQLTVQEITNMRIVVMGDRNRLLLSPEDIMGAINLWIPRALSSAEAKALGLESIQIIPGEINLNMEEVFDDEYPGTDFNLPPNHIMAFMNYQVIIEYNQKCFSLCT